MATDVQSILQDLTAHPSTDHPFLSVYLDWVPDANGRRSSVMKLEEALADISGRFAGDAQRRDGFESDRQRVLDYANRDAPKDARGLAIFACSAEGIWQTLALQAPVETQVEVDRYPHVFQLARLLDDYETSAVVLAEGQEARIFVIALGLADQVGETEAAEKIKRFDQGGMAQMLFQRRTDNVIKAHVKDIAAELERVIQRYDVHHVVIAGNDSIKGTIMNTMPDQIKAKLVDYIHLDPNSSMKAILETVEPLIREAERRQEADDLAEMEMQMTAKGGLAAAGVADVALALSKGQVRTLLLTHTFGGPGGECPSCGTLRAGQRTKCPYDGAELLPVDMREAFTARAIQQSAAVQIVEASEYLEQFDGVGALLRYRDDQERAARAVAG
jgi:peptide subunit release factor 1 (eRF1)